MTSAGGSRWWVASITTAITGCGSRPVKPVKSSTGPATPPPNTSTSSSGKQGLVRERGEEQKFGRNRCWFYRPGPECPRFPFGQTSAHSRASSCSNSERSTKTTSKPTNKNRGASAQNKTAHPDDQGHAPAPTAEATDPVIAAIRSWPKTIWGLQQEARRQPAQLRLTRLALHHKDLAND